MAMQFTFDIQPFGDRHSQFPFATMRVVSAGSHHVYTISYKRRGQWHELRGEIPKSQSGHRNFLHLLKNILEDLDWEELGENYVDIFSEVAEMYPHLELRRSQHPEYRKDADDA